MTTAPLSQPSADKLELLYRLSQAFNSTLELGGVLERVMDEVIAIMHAERGFIMLTDEDGLMQFRTARGLEQKTIEDPQFQVSRTVLEQVLRQGQPVLTSDASMDERFSMRQSILSMGLHAIICVPLKNKDKVIGAIYIDNRLQAGIFQLADMSLLSSIADSAAIAIENARLYEVAIEKGRMEREMQMARKVQSGLLPHELPSIDGWKFAAHWQPAREVGGDYYDLFPVAGGNWIALIADVTDKGMPAALFMASTRTIVRTCSASSETPAECIRKVNKLLQAESDDNMFVSMFYASIDPANGEIVYVNAGHNLPLWLKRNQKDICELERTGMWLGVEETSPYEQRTFHMESGDCLVMYTDGLTDAINEKNEEFGLDKLKSVIQRHHKNGPQAVSEAVFKTILNFTGKTAPADDMTLVAIQRV